MAFISLTPFDGGIPYAAVRGGSRIFPIFRYWLLTRIIHKIIAQNTYLSGNINIKIEKPYEEKSRLSRFP
jgi:hypothetical protein